MATSLGAWRPDRLDLLAARSAQQASPLLRLQISRQQGSSAQADAS